jgi:hypothetical protein
MVSFFTCLIVFVGTYYVAFFIAGKFKESVIKIKQHIISLWLPLIVLQIIGFISGSMLLPIGFILWANGKYVLAEIVFLIICAGMLILVIDEV